MSPDPLAALAPSALEEPPPNFFHLPTALLRPGFHLAVSVIKMTDVIEYVRRSTLNMTSLHTAHKRKDRSRLYHVVENLFATTVRPNVN